MKSLGRSRLSMSMVVLWWISSLVVTAAERPNDTTISFWVAEAFDENPRITATAVDIRTSDGIVTLNGKVGSLTAKNYVGSEAQKINGVVRVNNNLVVAVPYRSEEDIVMEIQQRLSDSRVMTSPGIKVRIRDGVAILTGVVASWTERQEAELQVSEVRGVRGLRNELTIVAGSQRLDDEIKREAISILLRDMYLSGLPIALSVKQGVVTLEGEVGNAFQKERADRTLRSVLNVKGVENKLTVQWWQEKGARRPIPTPSDSELLTAVRQAVYQDLRIESTRITVQASQGLATLHGSVPAYYQSKIAEQNAREVIGVAWVSNRLSVNAAMRSDVAIQADVRLTINANEGLKSQDLRITVRSGVLTLSGTVNTLYEKTHIVDAFLHIRGIRDVVNNIAVKLSPTYTDAVLKSRLKSHLEANWATRWVANRMTLSVTNATVTLLGTVNTWGQRNEAERVVLLTEGVRGVNNRLTVAGAEYPWEQRTAGQPENSPHDPDH